MDKSKVKAKKYKQKLQNKTKAKRAVKAKNNESSSEVKTLVTSSLYLLFWTGIMILFTGVNIYQVSLAYERSAIREAETIFNRDISLRNWFYSTSGIYIDETTKVPGFDFTNQETVQITTSTGVSLTKLTPSLLIEILNRTGSNDGIEIRLLSFDKDIVITRPDAKEAAALRTLEREKLENIYEFVTVDGVDSLVYIVPLHITEKHLNNPAFNEIYENYSIGELYAATKITIPLSKLDEAKFIAILGVIVGHIIIWLIGCAMLYTFTRKTIHYLKRANEVETNVSKNKSEIEEKLLTTLDENHQLKKEAQYTKEYKSEFLSSISHEVRTPLNGIIGMTELLLRTKLDDSQASMIASLKSSGNNLLTIINDIWDYAKIEANQIELEQSSFSLRDTLFDVMKSLAPSAYTKNIEMLANISLQAPDILVGDALRIRQVLLNLVDNAIKYTDRGEITLSVTEQEMLPNKVRLLFSIKDSGIGISPERQKLIFMPLENDHSSTRKYDGIGLGLAISQYLINLMGSNITLQSELNKGSTFSFVLELPYLADSAQTSKPVSPERLKDIEVLIVDDNATNRKILSEQTKDWGMNPTMCSSVDEALTIVNLASKSVTPISIILSDMQMPDKDGFDLAHAVKDNPATAHIPVIILSSGSLPSKIPHSLVSSCLSKPVRPSELLKTLVRAVESIDDGSKSGVNELYLNDDPSERLHLSILLVEDLEINQVVTTRMLEVLGHQVVVAKNGQLAIEILEREKFDIVLMDIKMPVMDGMQALKIIRSREEKNPQAKHQPIIALTANASNEEKEYYIAEGMDSYMLKPVTINELSKTLDTVAKSFGISSSVTPKPEVETAAANLARASAAKPMKLDEDYFSQEPCNSTPSLITVFNKVTGITETIDSGCSSETTVEEVKPIRAENKDTESKMPSIAKTSPRVSKMPSSLTKESGITKPTVSIIPPPTVAAKAKSPTSVASKNMPTSITSSNPTTAKNSKMPSIAFDSSTVKPAQSPTIPVSINSNLSANNSAPSPSSKMPTTMAKNMPSSISGSKLPTSVNSSKMPSSMQTSTASKMPSSIQSASGINSSKMPSSFVPTNPKSMQTPIKSEEIKPAAPKERPVDPPLDAEAIKRSFAGFPDLAIKSMNIFIKDAPTILDEIRLAIKQNDNSSLTVNAHAIKGLVSYYTKGKIYETALEMENMGRDQKLPEHIDTAQKNLLFIEEELEEMMKAMQKYIIG